jgi:hypothetical protein
MDFFIKKKKLMILIKEWPVKLSPRNSAYGY